MFGRLWALLALRRNVRLSWRLLKDPRVSALSKLPVPLALLYVLSPVDVSPDILPIIGQFDDLTVLLLAIALFIRLAPPRVVQEHLAAMAGYPPKPKQENGKVIEGDYRVVK